MSKKLGEALFAKVGQQLQERGFKGQHRHHRGCHHHRSAQFSTKNADKARDPDMHQTRKGQQWYFGMKLHWRGQPKRAGAQRRGDGGQRACHPLPDLLHGNERARLRRLSLCQPENTDREQGTQAKDFTNQRTRRRGTKFSPTRNKSRVRARRACLCGGQAAVGFAGKVLPRAAKERHAGVHGAANIYQPPGRLLDRCAQATEGAQRLRQAHVGQSTAFTPFGIQMVQAMDMTLLVQHCPKDVDHLFHGQFLQI